MTTMGWGSDAVAEVLRQLDLKYVALVPGASYRGLHDSIVNYLGNENPEMLLCLQEQHAIAIAHGYAKVTGKPMLAIVHANVGLMAASMAIFNAWCDRVPMLILGANGPVDAKQRRPWIDWIHTAQDLGAVVRGYTKWDDQPGSPAAAIESILRARQITMTPPHGPTYVVLDAAIQEQKLPEPLVVPPLAKFPVPNRAVPSRKDAERVLSMLRGAMNPAIIMGRCSRTMEAWDERIALVEALKVRVVSRTAAIFPTNHPQHAGRAGKAAATKALREADVILDLDSLDLGGILAKLDGKATVISCSVDQLVHKGWSMDYLQLPPVDFSISAVPDTLVSELITLLGNPKRKATAAPAKAAASKNGNSKAPTAGLIGIDTFSREVSHALSDIEVCYTRLPGSINVDDFEFTHPLDCVGGEGGGGLGSGPGAAVGAALALRGTSRMPVCVTGDGDFLMGVTALWTAVANKIPLLVIVANNRSYFNDEVHQEHVAKERGRPPERKWIGMRIDNPPPDLTGFAKAQGAIGIGPIESREQIAPAIAEAVAQVRAGKVVVLEVIVAPEYSEGVAAGITSTALGDRPHSFTRG